MKITCQSCQAKYTIADEKVAGKTVKIRCKKCSATIVVQGDQDAAPNSRGPAHTMDPSHVMGQQAGGDEDMATRVFAGDPSGAAAGGGAEEWTVNVSETDQRTMTTTQIVAEFQRGTLSNDTYVWKDGMGDWLAITQVPELMRLVESAGGAQQQPQAAYTPPAAAAQPMAQAQAQAQVVGLGGTLAMDAGAMSPLAARGGGTAAAAKKPGRAGAVDLFGAQQAPAPGPEAAQGLGADRLVGERNENSVLFSLSALTGAENAARAQMERDVRAPAGGPKNNGGGGAGRAGLDDLMNLGGGMSAAPMLAPPPLLAPVVEAPAPPPVAMPSAMPYGGASAYQVQAPQQKSRTGLFIAIAIAVVGLGGIAAFVVTRPSSTPTATADSASVAPTGAAPAPATASAAPSAVAAASATASAAPAADTAAAAAGADTSAPATAAQAANGPATGGRHGPDKNDKKAEKEDKKGAAAAIAAAAAEPAKEEKKPEKAAEAPAAGGGGEFDRAAAMAALGGASGAARRCAKPDGPTGGGRVKVTFAPNGSVTSATVDPPFGGTAVGGCVAGAFRGAHIPPFAGSPVVVSKSFTIN